MATEPTPSDDTSEVSDPDTGLDSAVQTLRERAPHFDPEIIVTARVPIRKRNHIAEDTGRLVTGDFGRPDYGFMSDYTYRCTCCDQEFEDEEAANEHLRTTYRRWRRKYRLPGTERHPDDPGYPLTFGEEEQLTVDGFEIVGRKTRANVLALVIEGADVLRATSRRSYALPPEYEFETWPPLQNGPLVFPDGQPRIRERHLAAAIKYLSTASPFAPYDPADYTLYDRGDSPFLLQRHEQAILIAPVTQRSP